MKSESLATLIELARIERDALLARQAEVERNAERARQSLRMLRGYTGDYEGRSRNREGEVRDPSADENTRAFLGRLGVAVQTQEQDVQMREQALERARALTREAERRLRSLGTLVERRAEEERLRTERRDQKLTDEMAQRAGAGGFDPIDIPSRTQEFP
jgi:flagellar FliJ protein